MADMTVSGVASGIDWNSMIDAIIKKARKPAEVQLVKRDNLELKKSLWEEFQVSLQALQRTLSPLKLPSTLKAKTVDISRLDSNLSYKNVLNASVNADAEINVHNIEVLQIAKAQINRSGQFSSATSSLSSLGLTIPTNSYINVNAGGQKIRVNVASSDSLTQIAKNINTELKTRVPPIAVTASVVDGRLVLQSDSTGLGTTKISATVARSSDLKTPDQVVFTDSSGNTYNLDNLDPAGMVIKSGSTTYTYGVDFDIVNGNEIRWREEQVHYALAGSTYQVEYTANPGEIYKTTTKRSADGSVDKGAITVNTSINANGFDPSMITVKTLGGTTFDYGLDYVFDGPDGRDIKWLDGTGGKNPPPGWTT
jgi:flagellar capping protein FliD